MAALALSHASRPRLDDLANATEGMKMSTTLAAEQIEKVVVASLQTFGADPEHITPDATFEALDIDSLDLAELSQIIHEQFGVELKGSDVADIKTVEDAVNLIVSRS